MQKRDRRAVAAVLVGLATLGAGCGGDEEGSPASQKQPAETEAAPEQTLKLTVKASPGKITFDKSQLRAKAGPVAIQLTNPTQLGHNVRIATGTKCCQQPGSKDIGGTDTIGEGETTAVVDLKPGKYVYYCATGGHWQLGQRGKLVVD
jgi:plastocyanin